MLSLILMDIYCPEENSVTMKHLSGPKIITPMKERQPRFTDLLERAGPDHDYPCGNAANEV